MQLLFQQARLQNFFTDLDWHIAHVLVQRTPLTGTAKYRFLFLIMYLNAQRRAGHVCILLSQFDEVGFWDGQVYPVLGLFAAALGRPDQLEWMEVINASTIVADASGNEPLILVDDRLYFQQLWKNEHIVANFFQREAIQTVSPPSAVSSILTSLFEESSQSEKDWQKVAVAMALTRSVTVISGGPGTGKTTTVAKIVIASLLSHPRQDRTLRIYAAAPTGKAAARLTISLKEALFSLSNHAVNAAALPSEAVTLHRLLGAGYRGHAFLYHKNNPLPVDILIVDEASMVDLSMMAAIINALPPHAKLVLLGDKEQLSSVEAGAVLGEVCRLSDGTYSTFRAQEIWELTGISVPSAKHTPPIADTLCLLQKSYRFHEHSGIGLLANDIKHGDIQGALEKMNLSLYPDIHFHGIKDREYESFIQHITEEYKTYLSTLRETKNVASALAAWEEFRLLAALREGKYGVDGLNRAIERELARQGEIHLSSEESSYVGRPVMILKNNPKLKLWNGDIGLTWFDESRPDKKCVYFQLSDGTLRGFSPSLLPDHETAFAMTVHKAQGSEFTHAALILPPDYSPLLTRALLYTAVTRAKQKMTLYGQSTIVKQTIQSENTRHSGLYDLLMCHTKVSS